jgi:hypothetical protein
MRYTPPQPCFRCKEMVPADRKSCRVNSIDTLGCSMPSVPKAKPGGILMQPGIITLLSVGFALCLWSCFLSLRIYKAVPYDLQAVPQEKAKLVQIGMTHQQVIDLLGRDAVPIPTWNAFAQANDDTILELSQTAEASLKARHGTACSPDRDDSCGAYYTLKEGSGLRIIYHRNTVIYASIGSRYGWRVRR